MKTTLSRRSLIVVVGLLGLLLAGCDDFGLEDGAFWPPKLGQAYPEITFLNYDSQELRLSDFKGKVVLVEPVGMTCEACNAFSGGNERGGVGKIIPQGNLESLETYIARYCGGVTLDHPDVVLVQVLLYDLTMEAPDLEDATIWAQHFGFDKDPNVYVVVSKTDLRSDASFKMIPGVQLVDKNSLLRFDSTGHRPKHNLWSELLPAVPWLLEG
jgi:hypothetical protein